MVSTTLQLDDELARAAEEQAQRSGKTLNEILESALHDAFLEPERTKSRKFHWVVVKGEAPPDFDVSDRNALFDRMEERS